MNLIDRDKLIEAIDMAMLWCDSEWDAGMEECKQIAREQPTVNEWIPVERELPENDERMLVVLINGTRYKYKIIARHCGDNEWVDDNWDDVDGVVAWMPIPNYEVNND